MDFRTVPQLQVTMSSVRLSYLRSGPALLLVPACCTAISAFILLLHSVLSMPVLKQLLELAGIRSRRRPPLPPPAIGTGAILWFRIARLLSCLGLFALSLGAIVHPAPPEEGAGTPWQGRVRAMLMGVPYLYASLLAILSISPKNTRHRIIRHVNCVLFSAFCVYAYRDILPFATFTRIPEDLPEGPKLWAKISLLFISGVVIPLFTPRQYIPVDPLNPMEVPNPEQTASLFSFTFYQYLDRIVFRAYRESRLKEEDLYPLCDTDSSTYLKSRSFQYLDGSQTQRHIFFGLMRIFY
ncbi:hypothetical protein FB451DRAFT_1376173 [Mycena latifolia]|nr:hypothetical protein FB451DRAFT_1376173 [Mycena latifolia]